MQAKADRQSDATIERGQGDQAQKAYTPDVGRYDRIDNRKKHQWGCNGFDDADDWLAKVAQESHGRTK